MPHEGGKKFGIMVSSYLYTSPMADRSVSSTKTPEELEAEERRATFAKKQQIMAMFSDNAKTYIQLSGAALGLTLTFAHEILNIPKDQNIADVWMICVWLLFLLAIVMGAFYQYKAVKLLELEIDWQSSDMWSWLDPGTVYGIMLAAFYGGTILFTIYAIARLRH